jgi:carboxypeptidase T
MRRRLLSVFLFVVVLAAVPLVAAQATTPAATTSRSNAPLNRGLVVRIYYSDPAELAALSARLDVWAVYPKAGYFVAGVTSAEYFSLLAQGYRVEIDTKQTMALNQPNVLLPGQVDAIPGYPCYRTVEETFTSAQSLVAAYPTLAQWIDVGDSWEKITPGGLAGYDLLVLKLTNQNRPGPKPKLFVMSSMHAREYAPAELNTRYAEYLLTRYGIDPDVTWLLDYSEIHLLLHANPDGRKQAETGLSWRKNTNNNYCANTNSRGVDLNRNYPFHWGGSGSSGYQCDETYRGPTFSSEPETQAVIAYVQSQYPDVRPDDLTTPAPITTSGIFLDLHSYGDLVLWPWGFTSDVPPNSTVLQTLGRKFAYFNNYTPQQSIGLYPTDGTTDDFAYGTLGVSAYTFEMGSTFFQDCSTFENTIVPDDLAAMLYAAKATRRPYMTPAGPDTLNVTATPTSTLAGATITLTATANDTRYAVGYGEPTQNIAAARYSIDAPSWTTGVISYPLAAADGAFNSPIEALTAQINTINLAPGRHTVFIEAQDANGNWGVPTAVFMWVSAAPDSTLAGFVQRLGGGVPIAGAVIRATLGSTLTLETLSQPDGSYRLSVFAGTYRLTASKYGYLPAAINNVTARAGLTTTQNITLTPSAQYIVSGTVRDQLTNRPVASSLTIDGYPGGVINVNPATGNYSVTLAEGITYTFQVSASGPGYFPASRSVGPLTADRTENFTLSADLISCTAADYSWAGIQQSFDTTIIPTGWVTVTNVGVAGWSFNNPKSRTNLTGGTGNFAIADSDAAGTGVSMDTELRTPALDFSGLTSVTLIFKTDFRYLVPSLPEVADVDVSLNGASGPWTNVWRKTADYRGPKTETVDLTALTAGQAQVMLRFHYYNAVYEWWWQVDDVQLGQCQPYIINLPLLTTTQPAQSTYPGDTVTYTLTVSNTDSITHTFDVLLDHNSWPTNAVTPIGPVAAHGALPFTVSVAIPLNTAPGSDLAEVTVRAQTNSALSANVNLTTTTNTLPRLILDPETATQSGGPGASLTYTLNVSNTDSVSHTFDVFFHRNAWPTNAAAPIGPVAAHSAQLFAVTVTVPITSLAYQADSAQIMVSSQDGLILSGTALLTTTTNFVPGLELDPTQAALTGLAGDTVTYTLHLSNTGNYTAAIDLDYQGSQWNAQGPLSATLAPWSGTTLFVTVQIPATATTGLSDTVHLTATSPSAFAFSDLITTASRWSAVYLPLIKLEP